MGALRNLAAVGAAPFAASGSPEQAQAFNADRVHESNQITYAMDGLQPGARMPLQEEVVPMQPTQDEAVAALSGKYTKLRVGWAHPYLDGKLVLRDINAGDLTAYNELGKRTLKIYLARYTGEDKYTRVSDMYKFTGNQEVDDVNRRLKVRKPICGGSYWLRKVSEWDAKGTKNDPKPHVEFTKFSGYNC